MAYIHRFVRVSELASDKDSTQEWSGRLKQVTDRQAKLNELVINQATVTNELKELIEQQKMQLELMNYRIEESGLEQKLYLTDKLDAFQKKLDLVGQRMIKGVS